MSRATKAKLGGFAPWTEWEREQFYRRTKMPVPPAEPEVTATERVACRCCQRTVLGRMCLPIRVGVFTTVCLRCYREHGDPRATASSPRNVKRRQQFVRESNRNRQTRWRHADPERARAAKRMHAAAKRGSI